MHLRLLCAGIATCLPRTLANNPCAEATSYSPDTAIPDTGGMTCGAAIPSVIDGVVISAQTCAENIDPFEMGDMSRAAYLLGAALACCSAAGHVCTPFEAQVCADRSHWTAEDECLNWQGVLGSPDTQGDAAAWCAEQVLGPSVSCTEVEGSCLMMARAVVSAFASGECCDGGADICQDVLPVSTCDGAQAVWYGLGGSCPEECRGEGSDEVCTRSSDTCGTAGCLAYLQRLTTDYTQELTSGLLECDPGMDVYAVASQGEEQVQAGIDDISEQCGFGATTTAVPTNSISINQSDASSSSKSSIASFGPVVLALAAAPSVMAAI